MAVTDWATFALAVPWFVSPGAAVDVGVPRSWSRGPVEDLPTLSRLLSAATVTPVMVDGRAYELVAWGSEHTRRGWLCLPPVPHPVVPVHPTHRALLGATGGLVERFGEPDSWWLNHDQVLTETAAQHDLEATLEAYRWLWSDDEREIPVDPACYYVIAHEANGNLTLAHRTSGEVLMFAPDHAFDGVTPLPGCPEYSLMTIDAAPTLKSWLELNAQQWL